MSELTYTGKSIDSPPCAYGSALWNYKSYYLIRRHIAQPKSLEWCEWCRHRLSQVEQLKRQGKTCSSRGIEPHHLASIHLSI
jgi:hypothetical protein